MLVSDFDYQLPEEFIAQAPLASRDGSRLLCVRGASFEEHSFRDFPSLLTPGDVLVFNDTRVFPARLLGQKEATHGQVELLLVAPTVGTVAAALVAAPDGALWRCIGRPTKSLRKGAWLSFAPDLRAEVAEVLDGGELTVRFSSPAPTLGEAVRDAGRVPLPPYIRRDPEEEDRARYQTVFAERAGSVAAPTAGLHFTEATLTELRRRGHELLFVNLEVGPGTFLALRHERVEDNILHAEDAELPEATAQRLAAARAEGRRIVAIGTTVVRTLEAFAAAQPTAATPAAGRISTRLFISPGFKFRMVDALLTNFHLPRSSLLMLVCAFGGREETLAAYAHAVERGFRFTSYGDCMFIAHPPRSTSS